MRRIGTLLFLLASFSLVLAPLGMLHAHIDNDHREVLVHGGHSHDFDHHHHDGNDAGQDAVGLAAEQDVQSDAGVGHVVHTDHVVLLDSSLDDQAAQSGTAKPGAFMAGADARPPDPPKRITLKHRFQYRDATSAVRRAYLHPPLRGPPAAFPLAH